MLRRPGFSTRSSAYLLPLFPVLKMMKLYARYGLALIVILLPAWFLFAVGSYTFPILNCDVSDVPAGWYMAFCRGFGDYEHQAAYFGRNGIPSNIAKASVVFLGDSRVQYTFSLKNTTDFFAERSARFYLNAFGYEGRWQFSNLTLDQYHIRPKILIINVDPFFVDGLNEVEQFAVKDKIQGFIDGSFKDFVERSYAFACRRLVHCTGTYAVISRSPLTGQWRSRVLRDDYLAKGTHPIAAPAPLSSAELDAWLAYAVPAATEISKITNKDCVVLTSIPNNFTRPELGRMLADRIGATYISPILP
jgi:hypothetical protein